MLDLAPPDFFDVKRQLLNQPQTPLKGEQRLPYGKEFTRTKREVHSKTLYRRHRIVLVLQVYSDY